MSGQVLSPDIRRRRISDNPELDKFISAQEKHEINLAESEKMIDPNLQSRKFHNDQFEYLKERAH